MNLNERKDALRPETPWRPRTIGKRGGQKRIPLLYGWKDALAIYVGQPNASKKCTEHGFVLMVQLVEERKPYILILRGVDVTHLLHCSPLSYRGGWSKTS